MHRLGKSPTLIAGLVLLFGCSGVPERHSKLGEYLVSGAQALIDQEVERVLEGDAAVSADDLMDDRAISDLALLRVKRDGEVLQLGPDLVSDAFMCLLGFRNPFLDALPNEKGCEKAYECEPCNSGTYPLDPSMRERLRRFWIENRAR